MKAVFITECSGNPISRFTDSDNSGVNESGMQDSKKSKKFVMGGTFTEFNKINENNRIYTAEEFVPRMEDILKKIRRGQPVYGEFDHPDDFKFSLKYASHMVESLVYNKGDDNVTGSISLLPIDYGREARLLAEDNIPFYVSSRAAGVTESTGKVKLRQLFTYDLVADPGFTSAKMRCINESLGYSNDTRFKIYERPLDEEQKKIEQMEQRAQPRPSGVYDLGSEKEANEIFKMNSNDYLTTEQFRQYADYLCAEMQALDESVKNTENSDVLSEYKKSMGDQLAKITGYLEYLCEHTTVLGEENKVLLERVNALTESVSTSESRVERLEDYQSYVGNVLEGAVEFQNYLADNLNDTIAYTNYVSEQVNMVIEHSNYVAESLNSNIAYSEYLAGRIDMVSEHSDYLAENLEKTIKFTNYIVEHVEKNQEYADYLGECLDRVTEYSDHLSEKLNTTIAYTDYIRENVDASIEYSKYLAENLQISLDFGDYLAETIDTSISYSEHVAESLNKGLDYCDYLAESLSNSINYSDYISESVEHVIEYVETVADNINESRGLPIRAKKVDESYFAPEGEFSPAPTLGDGQAPTEFSADAGVGIDASSPVSFSDKDGVAFGKDGEFITFGKDGEFVTTGKDGEVAGFGKDGEVVAGEPLTFTADQRVTIRGSKETGKVLQVDGDTVKVQLDGEDVTQTFNSSDLEPEMEMESTIVESVNKKIVEAKKRVASANEPIFFRYLSESKREEFYKLDEAKRNRVTVAMNESDGYGCESDVVRIWRDALSY